MEETAQPTGKYSSWILIFLGMIVFGLSLGAGYYFGREEAEQITGIPTLERGPAPVEYIQPGLADADQVYPDPGPVELAVVSEIRGVRLSSEINAEVLEEWWQLLGVDSQAVRVKELGGNVWYAPEQVRIVLRDISPLAAAEREGLYRGVRSGEEAEIVSGWETRYTADNPELVEYVVYQAPELYPEGFGTEMIEGNVNRRVFEVLYEAVVGSAM